VTAMKSFFIDNYLQFDGECDEHPVKSVHVKAWSMDAALVVQGAPPDVESLTRQGDPEPMVDDLGPCMVYTRRAKLNPLVWTISYFTIISYVYTK